MSAPEDDTTALLRRREAIAAFGAGIGALYLGKGLWVPNSAGAAGCLLQKEVTEGPYYLDLDLLRRNIRGGRKGTPLTLKFKVVDASSCAVVEGATVEIWHADAAGAYSGVQGVSGNWLRGGQKTNSAGRATFNTIVPGWYPNRTPHIHIKVFVGGDAVHTGQVFFKQSVLSKVYAQGVYASRGRNDRTNAGDSIYRQAGARAIVPLKLKGSSVSSGYTGTLTVGVSG